MDSKSKKEKCIICKGDLIDGPDKSSAYNYAILFQNCSSCGSYGYHVDYKETIKNKSEEDRKQLLEKAKRDNPEKRNTTIIHF